jgi:4-amino-4-deoxy-L-arabinose transferase-like glycosyltransferase
MKQHLIADLLDSFKSYLNRILSQDFFSRRYENLVLGAIIVFIFIIRILTIQNPALDRTEWKEIDYITISKNYQTNHYNLFQPTISWPAEPPRVTAMEFPLVPYLASLLYNFFGFNIYTVRIITLIAFLIIISLVFYLVKKELGQIVAFIAALVAGFMPLNSFFSNTLFSEPAMIAFSVFAIYHFSRWLEVKTRKHFIWSAFGFTLAILLKLEPLYLSVIFLGLFIIQHKFNYSKYYRLVQFGIVSILLPIAWYSYDYYLTIHSIDTFGIFRGHNKFQTFSMLSNGNWYRTMAGSLMNLSGGKIGVLLCMIGFLSLILVRKGKLFFLYLAAILLYFIVVAEGNIDASYRQLVIIPSFSCFIAVGALSVMFPLSLLRISSKQLHSVYYLIGSLLLVTLMQFRHYKPDFSHSNLPHSLDEWQLSEIVHQYADSNSKLVTLGSYTIHKGGNDLSPVIYYYTGLQGWTLQEKDWDELTVEKCIGKGADLLIGYNINREPGLINFVAKLKKKYFVINENKAEGWLILSLKGR